MHSVCIMGATGKLGGATLAAILEHNLLPASELVISTSSSPTDPRWASLRAQGAAIRHGSYDSPATLAGAFAGCTKLLLVSSPHIALDFVAAADGANDVAATTQPGRETQHFVAVRAARAAGVAHVYYTSLAFVDGSRSRVMAAHLRTEAFLARELGATGFTVLREGQYVEAWPLWLGYFEPAADARREVVVGGDGPVAWTAVADLGLATAMIVADAEVGRWDGRTVRLAATTSHTLREVAGMVSEAKGYEISLKVVSREEHQRHYVEERGQERLAVEWWARTYDALPLNECSNEDTTLEELLAEKGKTLRPMREMVKEMV